jgi:L-amino acid N-acyltransferase YncA
MEIRHAEAADDAAACAAIYGPYVRNTVISFEERPPSAEELAARIERYTRTHPWLVAEDDGHVIGFAYACPHRERPAYRWAADVSVYVDRAHHRRGIGRRLYGELLELLDRQGIYTVCAGVTLPNEASVGLHEGFGFKPVGIYRRIGFKAGEWWDVGWWQLSLREPSGSAPEEPGAGPSSERNSK